MEASSEPLNRDGHVFEFETGRLKWAGDASEVAGMLQLIEELKEERDHYRGRFISLAHELAEVKHRTQELRAACDQTISNLRVIAGLAEGSDEEQAIMAIVQETAGNLLQAIGAKPADAGDEPG